MKLYSRFGADSVDAEGVEYKAGKDGGIEVPAELGAFLHNQHLNGELAWENDAERAVRLAAEENARKSDPAYLASIVEDLSAKVDAKPPVRKPRVVKEADSEADVETVKPAADKTKK